MNYQYYPTGAYTASLLWNNFTRPIVHVCDTSAGKGALIAHALNGFADMPKGKEVPWFDPELNEKMSGRSWWNQDYQREKFANKSARFSAVEIDIRHHANLREVGAQIIGYDFMQVQSLASVTQVIMNPPFNQGCEHVLHAWDCLYDAEISACINAQTIKNPCTQERRRLVDLIEKHGHVSFHIDQFNTDDVERKTDVEIAIIYLSKAPADFMDVDAILGKLNQGNEAKGPEIDPEVSRQLSLPKNFIENTYFHFKNAVQAARMSAEYESIFENAKDNLGVTLEEMQSKGVGSEYRPSPSDIRKSANSNFSKKYDELKRKAWAQIIRSTLLTDKLSNHARRNVEANVETIYELEFSISNVHGFLAGILQSMGDIYNEMILGLFDTIIERSSDNVVFYKSWKSNQKHRVGMRIKKKRFIMPGFNTHYSGSLTYESRQFLSDVDKVFGYLDGVSEKYHGIVQAFESGSASCSEKMESKYFSCRFYKGTGTIHFYPKSEEVVERLNRFVGKIRNWIPQDMNEANKDFKKQYENAEKLHEDYLTEFRKDHKPSSWWERDPVYALTRGGERAEEIKKSIDSAINEVHDRAGLQCGPALNYESPQTVEVKALQAPEQLPNAIDTNQAQLDLLIA